MIERVLSLEGGYVAPWSHCASWAVSVPITITSAVIEHMVMRLPLASQGHGIWTTAFIDPDAPHHVHGTSADMQSKVRRSIMNGDGISSELVIIGTLKLRVILSNSGLLDLHLCGVRYDEGAHTSLSERRLRRGGHHIHRSIYDSSSWARRAAGRSTRSRTSPSSASGSRFNLLKTYTHVHGGLVCSFAASRQIHYSIPPRFNENSPITINSLPSTSHNVSPALAFTASIEAAALEPSTTLLDTASSDSPAPDLSIPPDATSIEAAALEPSPTLLDATSSAAPTPDFSLQPATHAGPRPLRRRSDHRHGGRGSPADMWAASYPTAATHPTKEAHARSHLRRQCRPRRRSFHQPPQRFLPVQQLLEFNGYSLQPPTRCISDNQGRGQAPRAALAIFLSFCSTAATYFS